MSRLKSKIWFFLVMSTIIILCHREALAVSTNPPALKSPSTGASDTGFNVFIGPLGMFQLGGDERELDAGPGFDLGGGYDWDKIGLRARLIYAHMDTHFNSHFPFPPGPPFNNGGFSEGGDSLINLNFDAKIYFLRLFDVDTGPFRPYAVAGFGPYFLEGDADANGAGGNLGWGLDYRLFDFLSVGVEQDFHFVAFVEDFEAPPGRVHDNGFDMYFTSFGAHAMFHF